jgi:4-carboxymuconolactone decarboxylase
VVALFDFGLTPRHLKNSGETCGKYEKDNPQNRVAVAGVRQGRAWLRNPSPPGRPEPLAFYKSNMNTIVGDGETVPWPAYTSRLDIEPELAVVYGNEKQPVAGFCIFNDVSARDVQATEFVGGFCLTKDMAKGNQLGPYLVTLDEVGDPYNLKVTVLVNGQVKYQGSTSEISHKAEDVFAWLGFMAPPKPGTVRASAPSRTAPVATTTTSLIPARKSKSRLSVWARSIAGSPNREASCCQAVGPSGRRCGSITDSSHDPRITTAENLNMQPEETRYDRGIATMRKMFGPGIDAALKSLEAASPDLARCLVEFPFADVYTRPGLDLKTREMLTVAALTVLGYPQAELKDHIRGALNVGCTPDQILEIILQMAVYAGFPAALEAVKTAASVFAETEEANR